MNRDTKRFAIALRLASLSLCLLGGASGVVLHFLVFPALTASASTDAARHKGSRFVFADLDGDRIPDLALVETQRQSSANSDYAIRVKLSAGVESAIGVSGPIGGLLVAARDVNGDNNLDLIVTADLDAGFIKVLLNDGHGNFSVIAPTEFLRKENQSQVAFRLPVEVQPDHGIVAAICSSSGETHVRSSALDQALSSEACSPPPVRPALRRAVLARFGRSPPLEVFFS
jgi:hypothetical protein